MLVAATDLRVKADDLGKLFKSAGPAFSRAPLLFLGKHILQGKQPSPEATGREFFTAAKPAFGLLCDIAELYDTYELKKPPSAEALRLLLLRDRP